MMAILLNYSIIYHDGHQIHNWWKSFGTVYNKIYEIVKFVQDHPVKAQLWQMGNLDMLIPS